ncbi:hypothetical protein [Streptomyces phaeofaciens]|uniref:hypothetical protein n=1 Tax=Streptomyces phaeofaciens TaxID=68254 RepID=UPI0036BC4C79
MSHDVTPPPMPGHTPAPAPGYGPPRPPRRNTTILVAAAAATVAAVLAATVTAGVTGDKEAEAAPTVTVTETVSAQGDEDAADADVYAEAEPTPEDDGDDSYALDDTVVYDHDVEVSLSKFSRGVSSEYASPENTAYAKFTIKVVNASDKTVDADEMTVSCAYGDEGREGEAIYDDGLDGLPDTSILAGRSLSVPWACELPKGETFLQVEVAPDYDSETAIFTGDVK